MALLVEGRSQELARTTSIEARMEHYADQLMAWPEPLAIACLAEHPKRSIYWPAWKELEDLRAELETEYRDRQIGLPPPGGENFRERLVRLGWPRSGAKIGMALAKIGAAKYRAVISRQHELSDSELISAMDRLADGRSAFIENPSAPFAKKSEWDDFADAMRKLRDPNDSMANREMLLAIGETIEARQRPHAQSMGWC